jgi:uncharacterized OsmC-like protein
MIMAKAKRSKPTANVPAAKDAGGTNPVPEPAALLLLAAAAACGLAVAGRGRKNKG